MGIDGNGWELRVERLGIQRHHELARTYGRYSVHIDGMPQGLEGLMCEAIGPGDNSKQDNGKRIAASAYPLSTQFGTYVSIGFSKNLKMPGDPKMPGVLLTGTDKRKGILIHPAHPPHEKLYLSAIGCLNPTGTLRSNDYMDFWDSRSRVLAIIASLRAFAPAAFDQRRRTAIPNANVVIRGEPAEEWSDA